MSKDPAFLFYPNDYLGGTMGFSFEQHGAYLIMLLYQFNNGDFDEDYAKKIVGDIWDKISHKFTRRNGSGKFYNQRLSHERELRENFSTSRREIAMKRWNKNDKPLSNTKIDDMHMQYIKDAHAMHMGNANANAIKDRIEDENIQQEGVSKCEGVQGGIEERSELFKNGLKEFIKKYPGEMLKEFFYYWTEPNPSRTKMRFELQKTWELSRRLKTWADRQNVKVRPINQNHSRVLDDGS
jgi:uncharacterized protein YdaU (DUF1376 family)